MIEGTLGRKTAFTLMAIVLMWSCSGGAKESEESSTPHSTPVIGATQERWPEVWIILVDLSASLEEKQFASVLDRLQQIFEREITDRGAWLKVYPIHGETGRGTQALFDDEIPRLEYRGHPEQTRNYERLRHEESSKLASRLSALRRLIASGKGRAQARTCILNSLFYVQSFLREHHSAPRMRLVFLSDMIEDCADTGIDMDLSETAFRSALSVWQEYAETSGLDHLKSTEHYLNGVEVTIYTPGSSAGSNLPFWIDDAHLHQFWKKVFERFGADPKKIQFR